MKDKLLKIALCMAMVMLLSVTALAADRGIEYTIDRMAMVDYATGAEYTAIPEAQFLVEVEVTNDCSEQIDAVMVVQYGHDGQMLNLQYIYSDIDIGETTIFGTMIDNTDGYIGAIKAFVVPKVGNMVPLANTLTIGEEIEPEPEPTPDPVPEPEPIPGVYTTAVKSGTIYADLGLSANTWATVIRNGIVEADFQIKKDSVTRIGGNGVLIEASMDEDANVTLTITDYYLAQVVDILGNEAVLDVWCNGEGMTDVYTIENTESLTEDQYVLVTMMEDEIMTVEPAGIVTGQLEAIGATSTYTVLDGVTYRHSMHLDQSNDSYVYNPEFRADMILLLDPFGYMIGLVPAPTVEVLDGYVLVTASECQSGSLASSDKALVEVLHLDGTGYEVLSLQTKRVMNAAGMRSTFYKNQLGDWCEIDCDVQDMIPYGFYGYYMTENDEIVLMDLAHTRATDFEAIRGSITANGSSQNVMVTGMPVNLILDSNTALHLVSAKGIETYEGYKNFKIDEESVDILVVYKGSTAQEIYVINGKLLQDDIVAYYNGGESEIRDADEYIRLYIDGAYDYYEFPGTHVVFDIDGVTNRSELVDGAYIVEIEGGVLTRMTLVKSEWHTGIVTKAAETYFDFEGENISERNVTYAENVEIYDLTDGGTRVEAVAKGDQIVYINSTAANGNVVTHIWILKHYTSAPVVNDAPVPELPWENGGKLPSEYTYEEYTALDIEVQMYFENWFYENGLDFQAWQDSVLNTGTFE